MTLAILILAAGQSSRMRGADKLAEPVDGTALLSVVARRALDTGLPVWVTLPALFHPRGALLPRGAQPVPVPDADEGMAASIRAGVAALPATVSGVMILPADMPEITTDDMMQMAETHDGGILRATSADGTPGHPVIFPRYTFAQLQNISGDNGARSVIFANSDALRLCALPGTHATTDLDTPEAWADWRARQPG
ncbi:nucleotidyltransferase family protein [Lutimaribacter sp. EGI FJ00015]|uniref:Nucleotidyltransferase family protein n=2 Tax=Lutimaribacter degradans TaxID=2945989 RepID=A0ACC5ZVQ8_9RHOB|nr:nucleotidyltransferase family protein [Lutimaribacter sp. EGI FJ00013]MCM2562382.1 nucleotidyltransferase family protein [Lutimaribacter sp. EGI FJ00013]MCO0613539.1 nucleotidyltransferase family protein [Lutimaribacter sp. EGI FJ00015]MCO0636511.1 nucleotidyltransferase family protein [Lutimaribacter sp. EGI FJ00014]